MSDPLDIVTLFDAKSATAKGRVARSKQVVEWAKEDLIQHEQWLQRHRMRFSEDLGKHQRRLKRRRTLRIGQQIVRGFICLVPLICIPIFRASTSAIVGLGDLLSLGCAWIGAGARALGGSVVGVVSLGFAWIGVKACTLGLLLPRALWSGIGWLGTSARPLALWLIDALQLGFDRAAAEAHVFGLWLPGATRRGLVLTGAKARILGRRLAQRIERQVAQARARRGFDRDARREPHGFRRENPASQRKQEAALARLREEHEQLQQRIDMMGKLHRRPSLRHGPPNGSSTGADKVAQQNRRSSHEEWVQLRELARNARRLFETQEHPLRDAAAPKVGKGGAPGDVGADVGIYPLRAGRAVHAAPALVGPSQPVASNPVRPPNQRGQPRPIRVVST